MIDDLLMLTCGWVAGVITTLAIRQAQDDERRPLDPALLPKSSPIGWTSQPMAIDKPAISSDLQHRAPTFSPYAPKPARRSPHTDRILDVWQAAKQDRPVLRTHEKHKVETLQKSMDNPLEGHAKYIIRDNRVCL